MAGTILSLLDKERIEEHYRSGFWRHETIYALASSHAECRPQQPAIRERRRRLDWRQLVAAADALAGDLTSPGVRAGERVALWLPSSIETAVALLACSRQGYVLSPSLHRDHTVADIVGLVERMRAAALIAAPGWGADADHSDIFAAVRDLPSLRTVYRVGKDGLGPLSGAAGPAAADPDQIVYLAFTSGTTGVPKGVMHSDNTLLANARAVAADWRLDETSVIYSLSPLSHNLGFGALVTAVLTGAELVVHDLPRGESLIDRLTETGATYLVGVPAHAVDLLAELRARGKRAPATIRGFRISGAAVAPEVVEGLLAQGIVPQSGYGMTETCSHQYTLPDDPPRRIVETSGRCCPGFEICIFREDDSDALAAPGATGQIGSRGASLMLGYFDDQIATETAFNRDGWFMTGDLAHIDAEGYLRLEGRLKDIVNRGGRKIYPARIEALALRHPAVARAAAFPVPDARLGEKLCLAVVFHPGEAAACEALLLHLADLGLSRYDMPEYFLVLDALPSTATGKPIKRSLIDAVRDGGLVPVPAPR
jgi:acyl-CoA synthetase (AMP-forming)/AMP-acid ligase II